MLIFLSLLKSYWKHILIVIVLVSVGIYAYNKIYNIGYKVAEIECKEKLFEYEQKMSKYKKDLDDRIASLEVTSNNLIKETEEKKVSINKDLTKIITIYKDKPMVVIEKETCNPSPDFISAYNQAIARVNR
jgi:hypothetical protein